MRKTIGITIILFLFALLSLYVMNQPVWIESQYTVYMYPFISGFLSLLLNWIPFSVGDIVYIGILLWLFYSLVTIFTSLNKRKVMLVFFNKLLIVWLCFYWLWGMNYFRQPLEQRADLPLQSMQDADFLELTYLFLDSLIQYRSQLNQSDLIAASPLEIEQEASRLWLEYAGTKNNLIARGVSSHNFKYSFLGSGMSKLGISGYFTPFTNEAHVNYAQPTISQPFTAVHEYAHVYGIGLENEANFYAFLLSVKSQDASFQYSAYFEAFWSLLNQLYYIDPSLYTSVYELIPVDIVADRKAVSTYWQAHSGWIQDVTFWIYEKILKVNNQPQGMKTYSQFTSLLVASRLKEMQCL